MLSAEPYPPYSPPAMVEHFVSGSNAHLWYGQGWLEAMQVDYRSGMRATGLSDASHMKLVSDPNQLY